MKLFGYSPLRIFLILVLLASSRPVFSQVKDLNVTDRIESARKLYYSGAFYAAENVFRQLAADGAGLSDLERSEVEAYKVMCAISLDQVNAIGLAEMYCNRYPNSPQKAMVREALASRYFDTGRYEEALAVYNTVNINHIYRSRRTAYTFNKAYSNMRVGNLDEAMGGYAKVMKGPKTRYTTPSTYYLGYVNYQKKDFASAAPLFEQVEDGTQFTVMARYFAVESRFMLKDYGYAIEKGSAILDSLDRDMQASMARIISESYYERGENELASRYLDIYKQSGAALSRKDHYFSGILSYSLNLYQAAIESFFEVLGENDELCQNAWYFSANSYLKIRNKVEALTAFRHAAEMEYDPVIREDAYFNYAKLSFDVNSDISKFRDYMEKYPASGKEDIINNYTAASFLLSKDYRSAVDALSAIRKPTRESSANLQKAAFFTGMQLVENRGFRAAVPYFELSQEEGDNEDLRNLARYWLAESYYRDERFDEAIAINSNLLRDKDFRNTSEYSLTLYNQAYALFKSGRFDEAESAFRSYLNVEEPGSGFERDARIRLADTYFMENNYEEASAAYQEVFERNTASEDLYPAFQAALSYGLKGDDARKIDILKQVTRSGHNSPLYSQCLFELGRTYVQKDRNNDASECFYTLLGMKGDSTFYSKALLELALINVNTGKYAKAIEYYKIIISDVPHSPEAQDAISGLESVWQLQNKPEEFLSYIAEIGMEDMKTTDEKESMLFDAAERLYLSKKYPSAVTSLLRFLKQYPEASQSVKARFYLAESYKASGRMESAADAYFKVMSSGDRTYLEPAALSYAQINYDLQNYRKALEAYENLSEVTIKDNVLVSAYAGAMRSKFGLQDYSGAISTAQTLLTQNKVTRELQREANYLIAKSYMIRGERKSSRAIFESLAQDRGDRFGAESAYILIMDSYDRGDFADVESRVYAFADTNPEQVYWLAKSFITLGDSFADRGDMMQARATFESIIEGYEPQNDSDDVLDQVRSRLKLMN